MRTEWVSLNLADILRERVDACAVFKRDTKTQNEAVEAVLFSKCLELFLDRRGHFVLPDDVLHQTVVSAVRNLDPVTLNFAYQDFYAYQFIERLNDVVRRANQVREVFAKKRPSEAVRKICSEAFQCFLWGHHAASAALIRSVLETALKERLQIDVGELFQLNQIGFDRKLYPKRIWHKIDDIRKQCNKFLHEVARGHIPSERDNLKLLGFAQEALQALSKSS